METLKRAKRASSLLLKRGKHSDKKKNRSSMVESESNESSSFYDLKASSQASKYLKPKKKENKISSLVEQKEALSDGEGSCSEYENSMVPTLCVCGKSSYHKNVCHFVCLCGKIFQIGEKPCHIEWKKRTPTIRKGMIGGERLSVDLSNLHKNIY